MPNHVTNVIEAPPEVLHGLLTEAGVDFNRVIPQPDRDDPMFTASRTDYPDGGVGYGFDGYSPMDWARTNWGTKWNAYGQNLDEVNKGRLRFETAWHHPTPVIEALSKRFPDQPINVQYADEDFGYNLGCYVIKGGEITLNSGFEPGGEAAKEFAARLLYDRTWAELRAEWGEDE